MDEREIDLKKKLKLLKNLKAGADPDALYKWVSNAKLALEFRETDAMIGLDPIDEKLIAKVEKACLEALRLAGEAGHEQACLEYAAAVWDARDSQLASAAARLAAKVSSLPESAYLLGLFHFNGFGGPADPSESLTWHRKAAEMGNAAAMFELYAMLSQGLGGPENQDEAIMWCFKSAEGGYPRAMANLGVFYARGIGVAKDEALALKWYDAAAQAGHGRAAATLGVMYALGEGAPRSVERAKSYFSRADECGFDWRTLADANGLDPDEYEW